MQDISAIQDRVDWVGQRLRGSVSIDRRHQRVVYSYASQKYNKGFAFSKYASVDQAMLAARQHQREVCLNRGWTFNEYGFYVDDQGVQHGILKLLHGQFMLFSPQHLSFILEHVWTANYIECTWYAISKIGDKHVKFHRLVLPNAAIVDHINHCGLDNRLENLRAADYSLNSLNARIPKNNKSGRRGVFFLKSEAVWLVSMMVNGQNQVKRFSIKKYGEGAYAAACAYRTELEKKYNVSCV